MVQKFLFLEDSTIVAYKTVSVLYFFVGMAIFHCGTLRFPNSFLLWIIVLDYYIFLEISISLRFMNLMPLRYHQYHHVAFVFSSVSVVEPLICNGIYSIFLLFSFIH